MPTLTVGQVSEIVWLALLPWFLARLGTRATMLVGLVAWTVALTLLGIGRPLGLVIGSLVFNGLLVAGFVVAGQVHVNRLAHGDIRTSVQGLLSLLSGTGALLGHLLIGWLRERGGSSLTQVCAVAAVFCAALVPVFLLVFRDPQWDQDKE
jgi:MFS family permease